MTDTSREKAQEYAASLYVNGIGPCLIPNPDVYMPSCHERDACSCDIKDAYRAGYAAAIKEAAKAKALLLKMDCDCGGDEPEASSPTCYRCLALDALGGGK